MLRVQSKIDSQGRVRNRVIDIPAVPNKALAQQPFGPEYRAGRCLACGHPQQSQAPHGWTCQRCDSVPASVSVSA